MKILINDYCGYPFELDLSKSLSKKGYEIRVVFTSGSGGPKSFIFENNDELFQTVDIKMPTINKNKYLMRWKQETEYGRNVVDSIKSFNPDIVISANTPLAAQRKIMKYCKDNHVFFIFWLHDLIGIAASSILSKKLSFIGKIIGYYFKKIEKKLLKQSDHIIAIADDFAKIIKKWGINKDKITVIPNWAPIELIPVLPKINSFSLENKIDDKFVVLYSGTMGMKHNPYIISKAAQKLRDQSEFVFIVLTDGEGMRVLKEEKNRKNLSNLLLFPFQPINIFPHVLASADVLITVLNKEAGVFSVPSKVWSGYCAGKASILILPENNLAAKITNEISAGIVVPNCESDTLPDKIMELKNAPELRENYGKNARKYAEENFRIEKITDKFESIFESVLNAS